jgi:ubiquinone/menaquinone biosynthesis C-methylase UbiE
MDEIERILNAYRKRDVLQLDEYQYQFTRFRIHSQNERERVYTNILKQHINSISTAKIMEIGAGEGINLLFFQKSGFKPENIYANDLRPQKASELKLSFPNAHIHEGDASELPFTEKFDVCFQSTVFTSILDDDLKQKIADKMLAVTQSNGIILWYDFIYNNPWNKDVKGIKKPEIRKLFSHAKKITFHSVTLAPPLGRRVGILYPFVNFLFPFLRTHLIAVIEK